MPILHFLRILFVYPIVVIGITWPLIFSMNDSIIGIVQVDLIDTIALRFSDTAIGFWPIPYPFSDLQPNQMDTHTFFPFRNLGFPLADNSWWLAMLLLNGWAGHFLGYHHKGRQTDGFACGIFFLCSETILRESTLHHAPQVMLLGFPLFFGSMLRERKSPSFINHIVGILSVIGTCLSYWYYGLFLVIASIPMLWTSHRKYILNTIGLGILFVLPFAMSAMSTSIASIPRPRINHNPWFFFSVPADKSGRISIILVLAFLTSYQKIKYSRLIIWCALVSIFSMSCTINAPLEESFPYIAQLQEKLPIFSRLHWPERWSILLHLSGALIIIQIPRYWLPFIFMETLLLGSNSPIPSTKTTSISCFSQLSQIDGNIVMWPWDKTLINLPAAYGRVHQKKILNPFVLPPGTQPPENWPPENWFTEEIPSYESLRKMDIQAVFMDTSPWSSLSEGQQNTLQYKISKNLGKPTDIGCARIWTVKPNTISPKEYQLEHAPSTDLYSFDNFWIR